MVNFFLLGLYFGENKAHFFLTWRDQINSAASAQLLFFKGSCMEIKWRKRGREASASVFPSKMSSAAETKTRQYSKMSSACGRWHRCGLHSNKRSKNVRLKLSVKPSQSLTSNANIQIERTSKAVYHRN